MEKKTFVKAVDSFNFVTVRTREDGESKIEEIPFITHFYVREEDFESCQHITDKFCDSYEKKTATNGEFRQLNLKNNFGRYKLKSALEDNGTRTYEADIGASKKYMLDNSDKYDFSRYKICHLDFESDDRKHRARGFKGELVFGDEQITGVAIINEKGEKTFFRNANPNNHLDAEEERDLIVAMLEELAKYDIVTAYAGDFFDFPFLEHRIKYHKNNYENDFIKTFNPKLINKIDFQKIYMKYYAWEKHDSFSLENVATDILGDGKVDFADITEEEGREYKVGKYYRLWEKNPELFQEYNEKDVELMLRIDKIKHLMAIHKVVSKVVKTIPEACMHNSFTLDDYYLREQHARGVICDSKPTKEEKERRKTEYHIGGGHIVCNKGIYFIVSSFDFKSHYPLAINTWGISMETYRGRIQVDIEEVKDKFTEKEFEFISMLQLNTLPYKDRDKFLKEHKLDGNDISMRFNRHYKGTKAVNYAIENNFLCTPADINRNKSGWDIHYHRLFENRPNEDVGILGAFTGNAVMQRDEVKYLQKDNRKKDKNFEDSEEDVYLTAEGGGLKVLANAGFGASIYSGARFFNFDVGDTITCCCRYLTKKGINLALDEGYTLAYTHTDSFYLHNGEKEIDVKYLGKKFYQMYKELFKDFTSNREFKLLNPETKEFELDNYWTVLEHEDDIDAIIMSAKARYYYLLDGKVKSTGGAFLKQDTNPLARKLQKELCGDFLKKKFDGEEWVKKLTEIKETIENNTLSEEYLTMRKKYSKHHSEFGQPMIDKKTGLQKQSKDGSKRFANIGCHIKLVKRMEEADKEFVFPIGDTILYILGDPILVRLKPKSRKKVDKEEFQKIYDEFIEYGFDLVKKELTNAEIRYKEMFETVQRAITVEEWKGGAKYDKDHYWKMITKPLIEILSICRKDDWFIQFGKLFNITERQVTKMQKEIDELAEKELE